jgi:hypothetical protein
MVHFVVLIALTYYHTQGSSLHKYMIDAQADVYKKLPLKEIKVNMWQQHGQKEGKNFGQVVKMLDYMQSLS